MEVSFEDRFEKRELAQSTYLEFHAQGTARRKDACHLSNEETLGWSGREN